MTHSKFVHAESALVSSLALPRKKISVLRGSALVRGTDWAHAGGEVRYSDEGRVKLLGLLEVAAPAEAPVAEDLAPKNSAPAAEAVVPAAAVPTVSHPPRHGDVRELRCMRTYPLNRRIVQAALGETLVRVRVKDSDHFLAGMTFQARLIAADLWELAQRLPRWKGKW